MANKYKVFSRICINFNYNSVEYEQISKALLLCVPFSKLIKEILLKNCLDNYEPR